MARLKLKVQKREVVGRKVKQLRQEGILPANVYGKKVKSQSVQLPTIQFMPVFREAGETGLVDLTIEKEKTSRPVLVHNVQFDPVSDHPLHVDFHQVDLTEKVNAEIPLELVGESPAVVQKLGILVRIMSELEVEALPTDFPEKIEVEIATLAKVGDMIKISDLKLDKKLTLVTNASSIIAKIEPPTKAEEEEKPAEEEVPDEEVAAEGETPTAEATKEVSVKGAKPETNPKTEKQTAETKKDK